MAHNVAPSLAGIRSSSVRGGTTGTDGHVVLLKSTAEWLHKTFGLPGFGDSREKKLLDKHGEREPFNRGTPISTYVDLIKFVDDPISFADYLTWLNDQRATNAVNALRRDALHTVMSHVSTANATGKEFHAAIRACGSPAERFDAFVEAHDANVCVRAEVDPDGKVMANTLVYLRDFCEATFTAVDLDAFVPLFTGEALRFDILPALVHAAGWRAAPGADTCDDWYEAGCDLNALPKRNDKPVSPYYRPDFGYVGLDNPDKPHDTHSNPWVQKLALRPIQHGGGNDDNPGEFVWWGTPHARSTFMGVSTSKMIDNWRELQSALGLVDIIVSQEDMVAILQGAANAAGGSAGAVVLGNMLERMRSGAIREKYLHRIAAYPVSLTELSYPRRSVADNSDMALYIWNDWILDGFVRPWLLHPTPDQAELRLAAAMQVAGLYAVMVASMLTVFTQQSCVEPDGTVTSCTFYEKTDQAYAQNKMYLPRLALGWNCVTLITFFVTNILLFIRERFLIKYFDAATFQPVSYLHGEAKLKNGLPDFENSRQWLANNSNIIHIAWIVPLLQPYRLGNLLLSIFLVPDRMNNELRRYPRIADKLNGLNGTAFWSSLISFLFLLINFIITAALLFTDFYRRYGGVITVSSLLSNTGLVATKVVAWLTKSRKAYQECSAISLFMTVPKCANAIDKDYLYVLKYYVPDDDNEDGDEFDDEPAEELHEHRAGAASAASSSSEASKFNKQSPVSFAEDV